MLLSHISRKFFDLVDTCDDTAVSIGAVNTVRIGDKLEGFNTDAIGFETMVKDAGHDLTDKDVLLLGCGGASMAVLHILKKYNVNLTLVNRSMDKAEAVLKAMSFDNVNLQDYNLIKDGAEFDCIINGTSIGLEDGRFPDMENVICKGVAVDLQYKKGLTPFLRAMNHSECDKLDGFSMLVHQGAKAFEIWTGVYPEFSVETIAAELGLT